jgi:hypothetical protein
VLRGPTAGSANPFDGWGVFMITNGWVVMIGASFLALFLILLAVALLGPPTLG